jgi:hypothetical protein
MQLDRGRRRFRARYAVCGVMAAAVTLTLASTAEAKIPEKTIKSECRADGGLYRTRIEGGQRYSLCNYPALDGMYQNRPVCERRVHGHRRMTCRPRGAGTAGVPWLRG